MTKEEILFKRVKSLAGQIPPPKFKKSSDLEDYKSLFKLPEPLTLEWIIINIPETERDMSLPVVDSLLNAIDDSPIVRNHLKRCLK